MARRRLPARCDAPLMVVLLAVMLAGMAWAVASGGGAARPASSPAPSTTIPVVTPSTPVRAAIPPLPRALVAAVPEAFTGLGQLAAVVGDRIVVLDDAGVHDIARVTSPVSSLRWSPTGAWLAYELTTSTAGTGDLYVVPGSGGPPVRVASGMLDWAWSPTRDDLAVSRVSPKDARGVLSVRSFDPDGTIDEIAAGVLDFVWSPDGSDLLYTTLPPPDRVDRVWRVDVGGACASGGACNAREIPVDAPGSCLSCAPDAGLQFAGWSSDGARVLLWLDPMHSASSLMDGLTVLSVGLDEPGTVALAPTLAKPSWVQPISGSASVVLAAGRGREWDHPRALMRCDLVTGACDELVIGDGPTLDPAVSRDGSRLASVQSEPMQFRGPDTSVAWSATRRLVVARTDGTGARTLTGGGVVAPRWAGDGRHLVFWRTGALWVVDASGGDATPIVVGVEPRDAASDTSFEQRAYLMPGDDVWGTVADWRP